MDSLIEMERVDFEQIVSINLTGAFLVNRTFSPLLRPGSRIVITTSELAPLDTAALYGNLCRDQGGAG